MEQGTPPGIWGSAGSLVVAFSRTWGTLRPCSLTVPVEWPAGLGVPQGRCPEPKHRAGGPCLGSLGRFLLGRSHVETESVPISNIWADLAVGGGVCGRLHLFSPRRKAPGTSLNECRAPVSQTHGCQFALSRAFALRCAA